MLTKYQMACLCTVVGVWCGVSTASLGQALPPNLPTEEQLAADNRLFLTLASRALHWEEPEDPLHIAGPLYFVGTQGLGAFLFDTSEGLVLMNTGMPSSGPMIEDSIRRMGFDPEDIRLMINGHTHVDHAGAFAYLKARAPQAQVAIMREDVQAMEDGGRDDFHYGHDVEIMGFPPVEVDRVLRDGERIRMGEVVLTALHTPGHTRGATTWVAEIVHDGRPLTVVFPDGAGFNPGYRVSVDPSYPGINADYRRTHHVLEMLQPDIWLAQHNEYYDFATKRVRAETEGVAAWIDPEGYRRFIAGKKAAFEAQVEEEAGGGDEPSPGA